MNKETQAQDKTNTNQIHNTTITENKETTNNRK